MAVTITKKFWAHDDDTPAWKDLAKIVFTSPNIDSPAAAGTRSHILPGSDYIGTWYEAVDYVHRIEDDQTYPTNSRECYFAEILVRNPTFTFGTDTTLSGMCLYNPQTTTSGIFYYDRTNYFRADSASSQGTINIDGTTYYKYNFTAVSDNGTTTITGSWTTTSGFARVYTWGDEVTNTTWSHAQNSIVFEVTNGEAYSCRLTAWDDDSHNTTANQVLAGQHYRVVACAYKAGQWQTSEGTQKELPTSNSRTDVMVHPPGIRLPLKGNVSYYGDFDLVHVPVEYTPHGEYLVFKPYLYGMDDSFSPGNYDFVTTLHYQYT